MSAPADGIALREVRLRGGDTVYWYGKALSVLHSGRPCEPPAVLPLDAPLFDLRLQQAPVPHINARLWGKPDSPTLCLTLDGLYWIQEV